MSIDTSKAELRDYDPLMQQTVMLLKTTNYAPAYIVRHSSVCASTMLNWKKGKTKRPQAATLRAVLRVLGHELAIVRAK